MSIGMDVDWPLRKKRAPRLGRSDGFLALALEHTCGIKGVVSIHCTPMIWFGSSICRDNVYFKEGANSNTGYCDGGLIEHSPFTKCTVVFTGMCTLGQGRGAKNAQNA